MIQEIEKAAQYIQNRIQKSDGKMVGNGHTKIGLVLGSGMGYFVDCLEGGGEIPYREIPSFCNPQVVGHKGTLRWGKVCGVDVLIFQGRVHLYEGYSAEEVVLPVRVCGKLGIQYLFLTNAAGGIHSHFSPGDLVMISDHINLTGANPLEGTQTLPLGPRFPDMTEAYDLKMSEAMMGAAKEMDIILRKGVYAGVKGPSFETPAEVEMLRVLGADMVGMSTVLECLAACHMGINVGAISCISNMAAEKGHSELNHEEVVEQLKKIRAIFITFLQKSIIRVNKLCR